MGIKYLFDLVLVLTVKEVKVRYKNSFLGYLWSLGQPLAFAFVFFVAFKVVMRIQMENYSLFLIAGLFPWQWFANSLALSSFTFLGNASIIKKVNFPRNTLVVATVLQDMIHFIISIPVLTLFIFIFGKTPYFSWFAGIPILLLVQFLFVYGICLTVASVNLFFRDIERLTVIFTTLLFYFTPIIYPESMIPQQYRYLIELNPAAPMIISWRGLFLSGTIEPRLLAMSFLYSALSFAVGYAVFRKLSWKFAEAL